MSRVALIWYGVPLWRDSLNPVARAKSLRSPKIAASGDESVLAVNVAGDVDGAALGGALLNVAVGTDEAAGGEEIPGAKMRSGEEAVIVSAFAAEGTSYRDAFG